MASVDVEIAARRYAVACRDGEEAHLREVAAIVDRKAQEAGSALGSLSEVRQLLFAALLLADEVKEHRAGSPPPADGAGDRVADALERLAGHVESLADRLDGQAESAHSGDGNDQYFRSI